MRRILIKIGLLDSFEKLKDMVRNWLELARRGMHSSADHLPSWLFPLVNFLPASTGIHAGHACLRRPKEENHSLGGLGSPSGQALIQLWCELGSLT